MSFTEFMTLGLVFTAISVLPLPLPPLVRQNGQGWPESGIFLLPLKVKIRNGHNNLRPWENKAWQEQ